MSSQYRQHCGSVAALLKHKRQTKNASKVKAKPKSNHFRHGHKWNGNFPGMFPENPEIIESFNRKSRKFTKEISRKEISEKFWQTSRGRSCTSRKCPEIHIGIFHRMESVLGVLRFEVTISNAMTLYYILPNKLL